MAEFLVIFLLLVFAAPAAYCVFGAIAAHLESSEYGETTPCTPTRRANITASQPQAQRERLALLLGHIDADYTDTLPLPVMATTQRPRRQPAPDYAVPRPADVDAIRANSRTYRRDELDAPPEVPPVPVTAAPPVEVQPQGIPWTWPVPEAVPETVPVQTNRMAQRFGALEL